MPVTRQKLSFWLFVFGVLLIMLTGALLVALHSDAMAAFKAVSCCGSSVCEQQGRHVARKKTETPFPEEDWAKWYAGYNEQYFLNQLPANTEVHWADLTPLHNMGYTIKHENRYEILIDRDTHPTGKQARQTLLHEQCHLATWDKSLEDGLEFQKCMVNLAVHGAFEGLW